MNAMMFANAKKVFILKQDEKGMPVAEICGGPGSVRPSTTGKEPYSGLLPDEMRRLKARAAKLDDERRAMFPTDPAF